MPDSQGASGLEGQTLGKKFLVRRMIGEGGMGAVYEAEHLVTKRSGALKLLHDSFVASSDIAERFLREASAAGRIGNSHIVETIDAGELPSGELYIFMELLSGRPLRDLLREKGRMPFEEARELLLQVADGLAAAHAVGIVHRDIKPDNLFLCAGARPFMKILDFGISKFAEQHNVARLTEQGATLGTPHYMSPEQVVSKRDIDARVDVYALGVVLYECVSGRVPFDADTLPALSVKIFEGQYAPASELVAGVPAGLDALLTRALARDPNQRFASVTDFAQALDDLAVPSSSASTLALHSAEHAQAPRKSSNPPRRRVRALWPVALVGLGAGAAAVLHGTTNVAPSPSAQSSFTSVAPSAGSAAQLAAPTNAASAASSPEPAPPGSAVSTSAASSSFTTRRPPGKVVSSASAVPRSRAAADGLSERNPFAN